MEASQARDCVENIPVKFKSLQVMADLKHICKQCFQCFLANIFDTGNILHFHQENLTVGEGKDKLMVASGQWTFLFDSEVQERDHFKC